MCLAQCREVDLLPCLRCAVLVGKLEGKDKLPVEAAAAARSGFLLSSLCVYTSSLWLLRTPSWHQDGCRMLFSHKP